MLQRQELTNPKPETQIPDFIQVMTLRSGRPVQFTQSDRGVYFPVSIPPRDTAI